MTAWAELPGPLRWRTIRFLRSRLPLDDQDALRTELAAGWSPESWGDRYPGWGTEIRELLRNNVAADTELPGDGWIDYWADAVEEAVRSCPQTA